jgi:hypothetical protein
MQENAPYRALKVSGHAAINRCIGIRRGVHPVPTASDSTAIMLHLLTEHYVANQLCGSAGSLRR